MKLINNHHKHQNAKAYLYLLIVIIIAYLPVSSLHFAMKNDAFSDNFPDKYFLSQSLHVGIFPLWNPYMNFGFPIYADPGFAYWNPITWLFALIGYNAYTLTLEVLLYLYVAGVCMYNVCRYLKLSFVTAIAVACIYMCSGFFIGCLQYINFLTAAAFLPFLLQSFLQLIELPSIQSSAKFSLAFFCVLVGGHPAIPIASIYFIGILFLLFVLIYRKDENYNLKKIFTYLFISFVLLTLLMSPMMYSYSNIWSFYGRDNTQQNFAIKNTGIDFASLISFLFPFTTTAHSDVFYSDVAMRNIYFSLFGLISLLFAFRQKNKVVRRFFITAVLMLLLSSAGNFKTVIYKLLPGLNFVRTNGEFRIFSILLLAIISGYGIENILSNEKYQTQLKKIIRVLLITCVLIVVLMLLINFKQLANFFSNVIASGSFINQIKTFLDTENLLVAFLISIIITTILLLIFSLLKLNIRKKFLVIVMLDVIINSIIYLPVTGIGTTTLSQIQSVYNNNPKGIPIPELVPVNKIDTFNTRTTGLVGDATYYNKKIGTQKLTDYPSYFKSTDAFFKSAQKDSILSKPYIFLKSNNQNFHVTKFSSNAIAIKINSENADSLYFLQNHYKFWKAFNKEKEIPVTTAFTSFMCVSLEKGDNEIEFIYDDVNLKYFFIISVITLFALIICLFRVKKSQTSTTSVLLK